MLVAKLAGVALAAILSLADPFSFEFPGQTDGSGRAYLVIRANEPVEGLTVTIKGDGQTIEKSIPSLKAGQTHKLTWTQKSGKARYELDVTGKGNQANFSFEIAKTQPQGKIGKFQVKATREDILSRGIATYATSFALAGYEYKVYDVEGDVVAAGKGDAVAAGSDFSVKWDHNLDVFMVWVRGEDEFGRFAEHKLVPWAVQIPHTEINFDSGKWDIKNDESAKLDEAVAVAFHELDALERVNKAVNANITPQLYIVGYTDTVGSAGSNEKLSRHRAKEIAEYFRDAGFWAEIYFEGMGERGLRVETGDSVDEVRNRRALYLISVQKPTAGGQIPGRWTKLTGARSRPAGFKLPPLPEKWKNYREEQRAQRSGQEGASDMSDSLPSGGGGDVAGDPGEPAIEKLDATQEGPPPVAEEPGATQKGCAVDRPGMPLGSLVLLGLMTVRRRRP
jgi:outer membrane protein OmpA-like peptidoglycan-associated protein